jgi:hypothetical protein
MFDRLFGKKKGGQPPIKSESPTARLEAPQYSWRPNDQVMAGFAAANIQNWLFDAMSALEFNKGRGVHAETLLIMVGALAGFSAQNAIWETVVRPGKLPVHGGADLEKGAFVIITKENGESYYFGDLLNSYLVPEAHPFGPGQLSLWNYVSGVVLSAGGKPMERDELGEIFGNAMQTIGSPKFGLPRLPEGHETAILPCDAIKAAWPIAKSIFSRTDAPTVDGESLSPAYWPMVMGHVAQNCIKLCKDVLPPELAMRVIFEAAVPVSKIDPRTVPQGPAQQQSPLN